MLRTDRQHCAGYFDAPAALAACPWGPKSRGPLPEVCVVFCAVDGHALVQAGLIMLLPILYFGGLALTPPKLALQPSANANNKLMSAC